MGEEQSTSRGVPTAGTPLDVDGARLLRPLTELEVRRLGVVRRFFAVHPVASDVLVCLLVAGASAAAMAASFTTGAVGGDGTPFIAVQAVAALLGLVAIAVRRRWPLAVLGAVTAVIAVSLLLPAGLGLPAGDAALPFALYTVAANRRPAVAWSSFGAVVAVLAGAFALTTHSALATQLGPVLSTDPASGAATPMPGWGPFSGLALASLLSYTIVGLIYLAVGLSVYGQRQQVADLVRRSHELVAAGQQQARLASMQERTRIARELHDVVAHSLSVMVALSDGARASVRRAPESAEQALDLAAETGRTALADMRRMLGVLRDGTGAAADA
ncbi:sensor histidine kinase, partial [Cellulomonas citrea]|uniref:sensor histidine kinase n=1 Tax=Cellulomonas citrea TaxID=1909423 RepID=UPI001F38FFF2